ncbi:MAG: lysoplasmalogenase [Pseudomonadota bacterium]
MLGFTPLTAGLLALSLAGALAHLLTFLRRPPSLARSLAKTSAVAALALLALAEGAPLLLVGALALSAVGDWAISRDGERAFLVGLTAFLAAHLAYVPLFLGVAEAWGGWRLALVFVAAAYALAVARRLWPHLGGMRGPVAIYVLAIFAMGAAAAGAPLALWPLMIGAALFIASDTALAMETFVYRDAPRRWTAPFIWSTYYAAQALIASVWVCDRFA